MPKKKVVAKREADEANPSVSLSRAMPRYLQVSNAVMNDITAGKYPVGTILPTEFEMCKTFGISRFTAREAMRRLRDAGLVRPKRRAGTQVIANVVGQQLAQNLNSIEDVLQYTQNTELRLMFIGSISVDAIQAKHLDCAIGTLWTLAFGTRYAPKNGKPICLSRIYLNPVLNNLAAHLKNRTVPIYQLIENVYGLKIVRIDQKITAVSLSRDDAGHLESPLKMPALRILRYYYDADDRLLELSDNIHPADRFAYTMTISQSGNARTVG